MVSLPLSGILESRRGSGATDPVPEGKAPVNAPKCRDLLSRPVVLRAPMAQKRYFRASFSIRCWIVSFALAITPLRTRDCGTGKSISVLMR